MKSAQSWIGCGTLPVVASPLAADVAGAARSRPPLDRSRLVVRAPQPRPPKIVAAPVNYRLHQEEMGGESGVYEGATVHDIDTYAGFIEALSSVVGPDRRIE